MNSNNDVASELAKRIKTSESRGGIHSFALYGLIAIGVLASAIASLSVATGALTPAINAVLAALPAIVVTVLNAFKFDQLSKWWWKKALTLTKIKAGLKPDGSNATEISQQAADFVLEHQKDWPSPVLAKPPL